MDDDIAPVTIPASFRAVVSGNYLIGGLCFILAGIVYSSVHDDSLGKIGLIFAFAVSGSLLIVQGLLAQLTFTNQEIIVRGIITRRIAYSSITNITWTTVLYGPAHGRTKVACYVLIGENGQRIKIIAPSYPNKHVWASLLLRIANERHIPMDTKVRKSLETASQ